MSEKKLEAYFFTALFVGVFVAVGIMFFPFVGAIATAIVLATLTHPVYERLLRLVRRPGLTAFAVTILVTLAILLPAIGLFVLMLEEVQVASRTIAQMDTYVLPESLQTLVSKVSDVVPLVASVDYTALLQRALEGVGSSVGGILSGTADIVLKILVTILVLFYLLRDGSLFLRGFVELSPLSDDEDDLIVKKLKLVSLSLIRGTLVVAILQGLLAGTGMLLFGVPNAVLWGSVAAVTALIPTLGTGLVNFPVIVYLFATGNVVAGIGFVAWSMFVTGTIDNILGPKLIGNRARIHPLFILLSVLGGLWVFGLAGFFIGPLLFGLLVALSEIYKVKIKELHARSVQ